MFSSCLGALEIHGVNPYGSDQRRTNCAELIFDKMNTMIAINMAEILVHLLEETYKVSVLSGGLSGQTQNYINDMSI